MSGSGNEPSQMPWFAQAIAWWHVALLLAATFAFYFAPIVFFGDAAYLQLGRLAVGLLAAAALAIGIVLILAIRSGSRVWLRTALLGVFVLDVQIPFLLLTNMAAIEILETRVGVPAPLSLVLSILLLSVPAGTALMQLRDSTAPIARRGALQREL
jgi:hypothetical protein